MNQLQSMPYKTIAFQVHFAYISFIWSQILLYMNLNFAYIDSLKVDIFVSLHFECLMLNALCFSIYAIFVSRFRCWLRWCWLCSYFVLALSFSKCQEAFSQSRGECRSCYISYISFPFMYCLIMFRFSGPCLCLCENEREVIVQGCVNCLSTCLLWECNGVFDWLLITNLAPIISSHIAPHLFIFKPRFYLFRILGR